MSSLWRIRCVCQQRTIGMAMVVYWTRADRHSRLDPGADEGLNREPTALAAGRPEFDPPSRNGLTLERSASNPLWGAAPSRKSAPSCRLANTIEGMNGLLREQAAIRRNQRPSQGMPAAAG